MYYYQEGIGTRLIWELSVQETATSDWWNFRVDAGTGAIIDKDNWTVYCQWESSTQNTKVPKQWLIWNRLICSMKVHQWQLPWPVLITYFRCPLNLMATAQGA